MADATTLPLDGETAIAAALGDEVILMAGVADSLPQTLPVLINGDPAMAVEAGIVTWKRPNAPPEAAVGFLAVIPFASGARVRLSAIVLRRAGRPLRYTLMRRPLGLQAILQTVAADAGPGFSDAADGLIELFLAAKPGAGPKCRAAALALLQVAARVDGFVEVLGSLDTGELYVQGWSGELSADRTRLIVGMSLPLIGEVKAATVPREDLNGRGHGFFGLIEAGQPVEPTRIQRLFFRAAEGWRALEVYDRRVVIEPTDVPAHIRDLLPRAAAAPETIKTLRRAAERFDGRDTVSLLAKPVRIGMDMVVDMHGAGLLVSGWLLDPDRLVRSVTLRAGTASAVVSEGWTRRGRPDVTTAFLNNPLFVGRLDTERHDHGFIAFVPGLAPGPDTHVYFEFALEDESFAYYPLKPVRVPSRRGLDRLLSVIDARSATASAIIDRHIGPMMQALDPPGPQVAETIDFGFGAGPMPMALIVGSNGDPEDVGVTLALIALDPETRALPIVVSAPRESFDGIAAEVPRLAAFYGLEVRLVLGDGVQDACDAFEAAVAATEAEVLVFLAGGVLPRGPGWLSRMERAFRARGGRVLVSPTVVFEDDSIRFAGTWLEGEGSERRLVDRFIGYPRSVLTRAEPSEVIAGSLACAMVSREAFAEAGGFNRSYFGVAEKGRDLCLRLRLAGIPSLWLPDVEMIAADEDIGARAADWHRLAQRIDRWTFDRRWSLAVANMRG